jgi:hypothetical protein
MLDSNKQESLSKALVKEHAFEHIKSIRIMALQHVLYFMQIKQVNA